VRVPDNAGLGMARVTVSFPDWENGAVAPLTCEIPVVDPEEGDSEKQKRD
jgi:hypothetical protein